MVVVHGTRYFRDRVPAAVKPTTGNRSSMLDSWYATILRWRPEVALFVNESTLLPVLAPVAPARTLLGRFPTEVGDVLAAHGVPRGLIDSETAAMAEPRVEATANRSLVGVMNEFGHLARVIRDDFPGDLLGLAVRLAATPCGPLYQRNISPDRELSALVTAVTRPL